MVRKDAQQSRPIDVEDTGGAWTFDVGASDWGRVAMDGIDGAITAAVFTVYGGIGSAWKDTGQTITPSEPVSDQLDLLTYSRIRLVCTTPEGSSRKVVLSCVSGRSS